MKCQRCGGDLRVVESADVSNNMVARKRRCINCRMEYYSLEVIKSKEEDLIRSMLGKVRYARRAGK